MGQDLAGKVAIVTGAASGIGRASAELFAAEGAKVVIADLNAEAGQAVAACIGPAALFQRADVADPADVQALVDKAVAHFGGLHVMFNNAAIPGKMHSCFLDDDLADYRRLLDINLMGVITGSQFAARHMARHGGGSIINTTSIASLQPGFGLMAYRAAKGGLNVFSQSIAIDLAAHDIRVNVIAPGHVQTTMNAFPEPGMSMAETERVRSVITPLRMSRQPLKRQGVPEDVAQAALFFASDRSRYITGAILPVDGGISIGDAGNLIDEIATARTKIVAEIKAGR